MMLDIATAPSRRATVWRNEQVAWTTLVNKLRNTHRTAESFQTYMNSPSSRRDEIKDIGGFVGGYLVNGTRQKEFVKHRQILAIDIDNGYPDFFEDFRMYFNCAAAIYSTHSHSAISVHLRLIIPLDRPCEGEEYLAIARKVSSIMGMKHICTSSFRIHQLMYWPSTAKDGDYYFREQTGAWLSADQILSEYRNWKDVSEWPLCPTETEIIRTDLKKQQDPREKEGVIGAFCRTYSITEAIETFLPDTYTPCGDSDRFTYCEGTTAAGAVCYDDKFLYSHHSTDPISGHLVNAFDMVRIHKFGSQDTEAKKVSLGLMMNLASTDSKVIEELGIFNLDPTITAGDTDWLKELEVGGKGGEYLPTINNFLLILRNDPNLKDKLLYSEFDYRVYLKGALPWSKANKLSELKDTDESGIRHYIEENYGIYSVAKSNDAFKITCGDHTFHPVREYLSGLVWDGTYRLDTLFIDQLGVPDTEYTRAVTRKALTAAVARVFNPGCKFDYMILAIGPQGKGKSSLLYDLGGQWFSDTLDSVTGKEAYMQIQGSWIIELGELSSLKKAEVDAVKHFITKRVDRYRVPFEKRTAEFSRQGVFFGSSNEQHPLKDPTGGRRFWPLVVTKKYKPGSISRDPIWAEAVWCYQQGEELYLTDEVEAMAASQQSEHTEQDERFGLVQEYLDMKLPLDWGSRNTYERIAYVGAYHDQEELVKFTVRDRVCAAEIWYELFKGNHAEMTNYNTKYIHNILTQMPGWIRKGTLSYKKYGNQRSYVRVGSSEDSVIDVLAVEEIGR